MKTWAAKILSALMLTLAMSSNAAAENMKAMGSMNIHYIALGATFLTPEVAKAYGIERSRYNGLVNISVLDNTKSGNPAKKVAITGKARNDVGQLKALEFKEVTEGSAIYYLAQVNYANEETIFFDISVNDGTEQHSFSFKQKFYVD